MKYTLILLLCLLVASICAQEETFFEEILNDKDYYDYRMMVRESVAIISMNKVDLKKAHEVIEEDYNKSVCQLAQEDHSEIRGFKRYIDNRCLNDLLIEKLDEKYSYRSLSMEFKKRLSTRFDELNDPLWIEKQGLKVFKNEKLKK